MSCKTPTSIARSLSPSDESRFVPHSSVVEASSVIERHFAASEQAAKSDGEKVHNGEESDVNETEAVNNTTHDSKKEPTLVADDEKSGIVGATICFTPEPSPRSSPNREGIGGGESNIDSLIIDSLNSNSNNYIVSVNGVASGDGGMEGVASRMSSSAMHVASSLDGRTTTEYEILDGISSKGTIEVEDLTLDSEDDEGCVGVEEDKEVAVKSEGNRNQVVNEIAATLANFSPCSTLPSLNSGGNEDNIPTLPNMTVDTPLKMFKTPQPDEKKTFQVLNERAYSEALKLDMESEDTTVDKGSKHSNSSNTSPKVDERPLTPFKNLHKHWEDQSSFTHMTKSVIGRILCQENPKGVGLDANEEANADIPEETTANESIMGLTEFKTPVNADSTSVEKSFSFEKSMQSTGTHDDEPGSTGQQSEKAEDIAQVIPKSNAFTIPLAKVKDALSGLAGSIVSFIVSASIIIGMFLYGYISSVLCTMNTIFGRILLQKVAEGMIAQDTFQVDKTTKNEANTPAVYSADPVEFAGTNLSKLFLDEALAEERKSGLEEESAWQMEVEEHEESSNYHNVAALDQTEVALLKRINDKVTASIIAKFKKAVSGLKAIKVRYAINLCALVSVILVWNCMFQHGVEVNQVGDIDAQEELQSLEEDDLRCFSTHMTNFVSVPLWELNLSPSSFESFKEELLREQVPVKIGSSSWLSIFVILSTMISLLCAFIFKSKIQLPSIKPKSPHIILTGIWTEEEHQQFLEGYNEHGSRWKLVSVFVPTRTHIQVKSHGSYWLKIRSPATMKKTRKMARAPSTTPRKKKTPGTPSSVSSTNSTPRKSNRAKIAPIKGILIEKDHNQLCKNVTPRSEGRNRRMMKMQAGQGSKSEPGKRRVRILAN
eukprot:CAMPEP_0201902834 /NCGR_PEP_ID=MMETSP0902-20130614/55161_1 /ASSEMBLY_ACC=CAM_ASM_000551 /TAXON_ID=420261 /ORGANISM="Thalassiosira antarctica, Strain CCMP982" /LENGTH=884 /DNA_ID=CAMNT_0048436851 /DNA_START=145 /DNA_END=2800 /DNA_ORIENTATION=-